MEQCNQFIPLALELLALSDNRRGEIAKIQLDHIDFGKREIVIPEHKTNTDGEGTPLYIPYKEGSPIEKIVNKAISLRNELNISIEDSPYLFPSMEQYGNVRRKSLDLLEAPVQSFSCRLAFHQSRLQGHGVRVLLKFFRYGQHSIRTENIMRILILSPWKGNQHGQSHGSQGKCTSQTPV